MNIGRSMLRPLMLCAALLMLSSLPAAAAAQRTPAPGKWIATWAASPQAPFAGPGGGLTLDGQTIRERVRISVGGHLLRIRLSNEFGHQPLVIGGVTVGRPLDPATVAGNSLRQVTFSGGKSITVPPGAPIVSDAIDYPLEPGSEIAISIYLPEKVTAPTGHNLGLRTAVITPPGDFTHQAKVAIASQTESILLLSAITVPAKAGQRLVVAFGDSITDGNNSTVDGDRNWPGDFLRRLRGRGLGDSIAVVNEAISGNQLRRDGAGQSALARFDRDVLALPGVTHVVILEGINDIGWPGASLGGHPLAPLSELPTAQDLIGAYQQLIARAHEHGIKVLGATLTPFKGTDAPGYYMDSKEPIRAAVNEWIRTAGAFDGVIDWDAALRDPSDPQRLLPRYASPDQLHPSNDGYQAMADAVDPQVFD
ncbi:MAG: SGNH/GDSL hydrolase family protein [Gammaproteobacteria bacterium]|nr:SGNH/GDSL hydrolase family protein [Gammaproteobacteria bacterium]